MGQKVLITAAASGIGLEIARAFVGAGATVFITDINTQAIDAARKEIPGLLTALCDNTKRSDIEAMVPAAVKALGGRRTQEDACTLACGELSVSRPDLLVRQSASAGAAQDRTYQSPTAWSRTGSHGQYALCSGPSIECSRPGRLGHRQSVLGTGVAGGP